MNPKFILFLGLLIALAIEQRGNVEAQKSPARPLICGCAEGWQGFKGHCYKLVAGKINQTNAMDACDGLGGKLASIHNSEEQNFLLELVDKFGEGNGFWLGLQLHRNTKSKGLISCSWMDGSPFDYGDCKKNSGMAPWATKNGAIPEPNNGIGGEDCVYIRGEDGGWKHGWVDIRCDQDHFGSDMLGFVCKK